MGKQIKSKQRVRDFAEVFTAEKEVKAMCDLLPEYVFSNIEKTFLEPACGEGAFLCEVYARKLKYCMNESEGLKALNSLFGIDIQADNIVATRKKLVEMYLTEYPKANNFAAVVAWGIVGTNIVKDDFLNPSTDIVKSWGVTTIGTKTKGGKNDKRTAD